MAKPGSAERANRALPLLARRAAMRISCNALEIFLVARKAIALPFLTEWGAWSITE
jgi:hypothetical protein